MSTILRLCIILFLSTIFFVVPTKASAESIRSFDSSISISKDASIHVMETITYDFGTEQRHGIFRTIPTVNTNADGKRFRSGFSLTRVLLNGSPIQYQESKTGDGVEIKIGDANKTITGIQTYTINYDMVGPVQYFSDHDELYWNITGNGWDVPIGTVSSTVVVPDVLSNVLKGVCYTGITGSTVSDCTVNVENNTLAIRSERPLSAHEGLTVAASFPKGIVDVIEQTPETNLFFLIQNVWIKIALFLGYVVLPGGFFFWWWKNGRDPVIDNTIVRVFDPPKHTDGRTMSPVEVGCLVDEVINPRDISAEIVSLAIKKYIIIKEHPKKLGGLIGGDIEFLQGKALVKDPDIKLLSKQEREILTALTVDSQPAVKLADIKDSFAKNIQPYQEHVYKGMVSDGIFPRNPQSVRNHWLIAGFIALFTGNILLAVVLFNLSRVMPKRTLFGAEAKRYGLGLKSFLDSQDRQLAFQEKEFFLFEKLLPYAIVFGVAKVWAKRFEHMTQYQPDWYESNSSHSFTPYLLVNSLNNNLSTIQSSYTPTSSSSGFSSGFSGGSSGGGFGGGGGGSW